MEESICCVMVEQKDIKKMKKKLESNGLLCKDYKISKFGTVAALPITFKDVCDIDSIHTLLRPHCPFTLEFVNYSKLCSNIKTHSEKLHVFVRSYLDGLNVSCELKKELLADLPSKWDLYGDLIMFPHSHFMCDYWSYVSVEFWECVSKIFGVSRIAIKSRINKGGYRVPKTILKLGDNGVVENIDNGIVYTFDVTKNMFSKGNITEKLRISKLNCYDEVVVDLFAGIGYFTLPYLKANVKMVYACDWNPDAIYFLKQNLSLNNVADRCIVLEGDNREVAPKNIADRVNLGLIPSSSCSWKVACESLKIESGGWLHIHENIESKGATASLCDCALNNRKCVISEAYTKSLNVNKRIEWCGFVKQCVASLEGYLNSSKHWSIHLGHIEYVKSYAPHIDHLVFDFECRPN